MMIQGKGGITMCLTDRKVELSSGDKETINRQTLI